MMPDRERIAELFEETLQPLAGLQDGGGPGVYGPDVRSRIVKAAAMAKALVVELSPASPFPAELDTVIERAHDGRIAPSTARGVIEAAKWHFTQGLGARAD